MEPSGWNDTGVKGVRALNLWQADSNGKFRATEKLRKETRRDTETLVTSSVVNLAARRKKWETTRR